MARKKALLRFRYAFNKLPEKIKARAVVAAALGAGYVGVKIDGDLEEALVERFKVTGYPTMVVLDSAGAEGLADDLVETLAKCEQMSGATTRA